MFSRPLQSQILWVTSQLMWIWLQITFGASYFYSAEAEAPTLWPPDVKTRPTGKDWRQEEKEKEVTEDEMVGWHHQFNGHETEQTLGVVILNRGNALNNPHWQLQKIKLPFSILRYFIGYDGKILYLCIYQQNKTFSLYTEDFLVLNLSCTIRIDYFTITLSFII